MKRLPKKLFYFHIIPHLMILFLDSKSFYIIYAVKIFFLFGRLMIIYIRVPNNTPRVLKQISSIFNVLIQNKETYESFVHAVGWSILFKSECFFKQNGIYFFAVLFSYFQVTGEVSSCDFFNVFLEFFFKIFSPSPN